MENEKQTNNGLVRLIVLVIAVLVAYGIFSLIQKGGAYGRNIKVKYANEYSVGYIAKCPYCSHNNSPSIAPISKGEHYESTAICQSCGKAFEITVNR